MKKNIYSLISDDENDNDDLIAKKILIENPNISDIFGEFSDDSTDENVTVSSDIDSYSNINQILNELFDENTKRNFLEMNFKDHTKISSQTGGYKMNYFDIIKLLGYNTKFFTMIKKINYSEDKCLLPLPNIVNEFSTDYLLYPFLDDSRKKEIKNNVIFKLKEFDNTFDEKVNDNDFTKLRLLSFLLLSKDLLKQIMYLNNAQIEISKITDNDFTDCKKDQNNLIKYLLPNLQYLISKFCQIEQKNLNSIFLEILDKKYNEIKIKNFLSKNISFNSNKIKFKRDNTSIQDLFKDIYNNPNNFDFNLNLIDSQKTV